MRCPIRFTSNSRNAGPEVPGVRAINRQADKGPGFLIVLALLLALTAVTGCARNRATAPVPPPSPMPAAPSAAAPSPSPQPAASGSVIVTPDTSTTGKIAMVNAQKAYVILTFPIGEVPVPEQPLHVYRNGLKVAKLKVTGPRRDFNTVADIVEGECKVGDEVRDR